MSAYCDETRQATLDFWNPNGPIERPKRREKRGTLRALFSRKPAPRLRPEPILVQKPRRLFPLLVLIGSVGIASVSFAQLPGAGRISESKQELRLVDEQGRARALLRLVEGVPVLQLIDAAGHSRLTMGLRLDDAPFIDLADEHGVSRVTLRIGGDNQSSLEIFDGSGHSRFQLN